MDANTPVNRKPNRTDPDPVESKPINGEGDRHLPIYFGAYTRGAELIDTGSRDMEMKVAIWGANRV